MKGSTGEASQGAGLSDDANESKEPPSPVPDPPNLAYQRFSSFEDRLLDEAMARGLLPPQEILRERTRRDRHRLWVLYGLLAYLLVCGVGAVWLLANRTVDSGVVQTLLQVFVISLVPVITIVVKSFFDER